MKANDKFKRYAISAVCLLLMGAGIWYYTRMAGGYHGTEPAWVYIPSGATAEQVKDSLRSSLGDDFGGTVAFLWCGDPERSHGAYRIEPKEKAWKVARRLDQAQQTPVRVTFNNIRTFGDLADRMAARMDFTATEFINSAERQAETDSLSKEEFEAQFLPDTYETYWTATPEQLMDKIRKHYNGFWTTERLAKAKSMGLTPLQVSILASIVEEESNKRDERGKIARLYLNRLDKGMKLQADPTVRFAKGDFTIKRVTGDMLSIQSPYNTYVVDGLPPGIIRLPEARTIDQVLDAPRHNYLYMCARPDGSGYHDFTADYSAHLRNARAYRSATYGSH